VIHDFTICLLRAPNVLPAFDALGISFAISIVFFLKSKAAKPWLYSDFSRQTADASWVPPCVWVVLANVFAII
jgi:hypothetical protein